MYFSRIFRVAVRTHRAHLRLNVFLCTRNVRDCGIYTDQVTELQQIAKNTHTHTHTLEEIDGEAAKMALTLQRDQALARIIAKGPGAELRESGNVARRVGNIALFRSSASTA